jgi:hypothetical protein
MNITKQQLKQIIKEELADIVEQQGAPEGRVIGHDEPGTVGPGDQLEAKPGLPNEVQEAAKKVEAHLHAMQDLATILYKWSGRDIRIWGELTAVARSLNAQLKQAGDPFRIQLKRG